MPKKVAVFTAIKNCHYLFSFYSKPGNVIKFLIKEDNDFGEYTIKMNKKIFNMNYFNGDNVSLSFDCESLFFFKIKIIPKDIVIRQVYVTEHLRETFGKDLKQSTSLIDYNNDHEPAIFYGIWSDDSLQTLRNNKSLKIIIWSGGDINAADYRTESLREHVNRNIEQIKKLKKVVHISKSPFIGRSLESFGLSYLTVPYSAINLSLFEPTTKGASIYIYTAPSMEWYYGADLYDQVVQKYRHINFIFACSKKTYEKLIKKEIKYKYNINYYEKDELIKKIYPQCFLALRLTIHDGIANTVQELGLMGIKSVHNGDGPSCLKYQTFEDVCNHIDNEAKTIGLKDDKLANDVKKYLTLPKNFYSTSYFKNRFHQN